MNYTYDIKKYPRTPHLEGSRLQDGDYDLSQIKFSDIKGRHLVVEEKIDGANVGISFSEDGDLLLQSRGHYLRGGAKEQDYQLFKVWATTHSEALFNALGARYIMYGEWMYIKHVIFYDHLPHYFMEFDIYDKEKQIFLDTRSRHEITKDLPICSVPVLGEGEYTRKSDLLSHLGDSLYKTKDCPTNLIKACESDEVNASSILEETDTSPEMEGLYIKIEENGQVAFRLKYVRASYRQLQKEDSEDYFVKPKVHNLISVPLEDIFKA